jgi:hypothetical protein
MARNRVAKLQLRRTDSTMKASSIHEVYDRISEDESIRYAIGAMQPIEKEYTANTYAEGDRVKSQLQNLNSLKETVEFEYQGSVTNDTHIKAHSDIDLLALHAGFFSIQPPGSPISPYKGDPMQDLKDLRQICVQNLKRAFPAVVVDDRPGKCIALSGGSLRREIDVVISNWWNTVEYQNSGQKVDRGIKIFDSKLDSRVENKPFKHNLLIDLKDKQVNGNLRKVIRLLKSLKYDAEPSIRMSSYDIASIAFDMPASYFNASKGSELLLVENCRIFLKFLLDNKAYRDAMRVPNGMRLIFGNDGATEAALIDLHREVVDLLTDIANGLTRSFKKLADARISY